MSDFAEKDKEKDKEEDAGDDEDNSPAPVIYLFYNFNVLSI